MKQLKAMITMLVLPASLALGGGGLLGAAEDTPPARSLLAEHLAQAQAIQAVTATGSSASPVQQTDADVHAARAAAEDFIKREHDAQANVLGRAGWQHVLQGLTSEEIARSALWNKDADALTRELATQPTLGTAMLAAALRNQEVEAAHQNWRAALARFDQADYLQDLVSQYRAFVREIDLEVGPQQHKEGDDASFAAPSILALKGELVDADVAIAHWQYLQKLRSVVMEVAKEYFETQYHMQTAEIRKSNRVLVLQMQESAQAQLRAGRGSQADVLKTQVMLDMTDNQIAQEVDHIVPHHMALLNALLNLPAETPWGTLKRVDLPQQLPAADGLMNEARANNPELRQATVEVHATETMLRMAETMVLPRASVGYSRIKPSAGAEAGTTRNPDTTFPDRARVEMPMSEFSSNLAYLDELRIRVLQAQAQYRSVFEKVPADVLVKHHYVHLAVRTMKTLDTVVPLSKQAFDLVKANYAAGNSSMVEFLDAGRAYFDNVLMQEEARMDLNERWADLQGALGLSVSPLLTQPTATLAPPLPPTPPADHPVPTAPVTPAEGHGHD